MLPQTRRVLPMLLAGLLVAGLSTVQADDPIADVRARMKVEAERIEREFTRGRIEAYRLVRRENADLDGALEKLYSLLNMVRASTGLENARRDVFIVTLKADLNRVRDIAGERRRVARAFESATIARDTRESIRRADTERRGAPGKTIVRDAASLIESRGKMLADSRLDSSRYGDRFNRVLRSVDESALPESRDYVLPPDWDKLSKRRSATAKLSEKERAIMKALSTSLEVEFVNNTFQEVIDYLQRVMRVTITVDKRAMDEVSVTYDTPITLKMRSSNRSILKRMLGNLNLTYVIKDETILVTSRERAKEMTTTRAYYIGDLVNIPDFRLPPAFTQAAMIENVNRIIASVTQQVDPQSWRMNNPDAPGAIVFDPITMTLIVKQTAEVHYMMGGYR